TNLHDSVLYVGMTNDLTRRVSEHRSGEVPGFTSAYRCRKLIYYEHCTDVQDAIAREKQLKKWSRQKKVALIATLNPTGKIWRRRYSEKSKRCLDFARHDKRGAQHDAGFFW